jgi:alkanesulfonate monooxygenase SsuD/methylene tetrahydromethanopterin reductase-like flavin-dependent oxidoreductase (luciferase family)
VKVGITLPQFQADPEACIEVAQLAERAGLDGVFVFDHLWPIGRPDRPAIHGLSLLAALAAETERVSLGMLVARVGVLPDAVLVNVFATLQRMAGDRLIAGLGLGDRLSAEENRAYGVDFLPVAERKEAVARCCQGLRGLGITTWVGGLGEGTRALGRAEADVVNLWGVAPEAVAEEVARPDSVEVTWGGQLDLSAHDPEPLLARLAGAGASWSIVAPLRSEWATAVQTIAGAAEGLSLH